MDMFLHLMHNLPDGSLQFVPFISLHEEPRLKSRTPHQCRNLCFVLCILQQGVTKEHILSVQKEGQDLSQVQYLL